ncbi:uncharacterized protein LOC135502518 isoform X2 [Lineus longissimus]|uniref:uncharacterized protein LOC135502518 isoform X2 n=1 Tax=Lineus longissimus TaxID=88925 RepID=UPI00315D1984
MYFHNDTKYGDMEHKVVIFLVTLLVITQTALTGVYSLNDITVQPGPVEVKQGQNVSMWCKMKYDPHKVVPVVWHTPPNFRTRTNDCSSFVKNKYIMSCSDTEDPFGYYNMTIMDVQWADNGTYRCLYTKHMDIVDLQVLVPVTNLTVEKIIKSSAAESQPLHGNFTCTTNCAFPAPKISWLINDQPFNGNATVTELVCSGAKDGQKQTMSTVMIMSTDMDKERKEYNITCTAENVVGEPNVSKAITVNNVVPVTDVTLEKIIKSSATEPQRLHKYFTCTTNCAFPAPKIAWLVNDEHFNGKTTVRELGCSGAREGQKQTMSTVLVMSTDMDKERKEYNIKCTAENVVGEPNVSETMAVSDDVPVTEVTLEKDVKSTAVESQRLHEYFTCTTNCAFPAPKISWLVNYQPFNGNASVGELNCSGLKEGQKRTESRVLVMSTDMDKERKEYDILCTAENVFGGPKVSKAMAVIRHNDLNAVTPSPPQHKVISALLVVLALLFTLIVIGSIGITVYVKRRHALKDDSSREARFNEHSAPPKYEKNDGIKYHNVSTSAHDFHNAHNEERLLSAPTSLENGDGFGRTIVPRFF